MEELKSKWIPKQGEKIWLKVFSNWSTGIYIGFDITINKYIAREDHDGGYILSSADILPLSENPNKIEE